MPTKRIDLHETGPFIGRVPLDAYRSSVPGSVPIFGYPTDGATGYNAVGGCV